MSNFIETPAVAPPLELDASPSQRSLWLGHQTSLDAAAYNVPLAWRIRGPLRPSVLEAAFRAVVLHHEGLRASFASAGDRLSMRIEASLSVDLPCIDVESYGEEAYPNAMRLAHEQARLPFELTKAPLVRGALYRLCADDHVLLLNLHHIVTDGWSMQILLQDLSDAYAALENGNRWAPPELDLALADYVNWQHKWLSTAAASARLAFWTRRLAGAGESLDLGVLAPTAPTPSARSELEAFSLSRQDLDALTAFTRQRRTTRFVVIAAVLNWLLHRFTSQTDLTLGYATANRQRHETHGIVGCFVNTLVLRTRLDPHQDFDALLTQVRDAVLRGAEHEDVPYEHVLEALRRDGRPRQMPLFQVFYSFVEPVGEASDDALVLGAATVLPVELEVSLRKVPLFIEVTCNPDGLAGKLVYDPNLFDAGTMRAMARAFEALLAVASSAASQPLAPTPGQADPLDALATHCPNYAVWQRRRADDLQRRAHLVWWVSDLRDAPTLPQLPSDQPREIYGRTRGGVQQGARAAVHEFALTATTTQTLERLAREHRTTLFVALLSVYQVLLARWSGQNDVCVGTSLDQRDRKRLESGAGYLVKPVPMRARMDMRSSFSAFLDQAREHMRAVLEHQDIDYPTLLKALDPDSQSGRGGLFETTLIFHDTHASTAIAPAIELKDWGAEPVELDGDSRSPRFDLMVEWHRKDDGLLGVQIYDVTRYDSTTVRAWMERYVRLLESFAARPDQALHEPDLLLPSDLILGLVPLAGAPAATTPTAACQPSLAALWREQVQRTPQAEAVVEGKSALSYAELDERASRLARHLLNCGVRRGDCVGVFLPRGIHAVTTLLAVVLAGGAYVPLDEHAPPARLTEIVEDAGLTVCVGVEATLDALDRELLMDLAVVSLDGEPDWQTPTGQPPMPVIHGQDLAYVVYTSGSTGRPKGVSVPHEAVARLVRNSNYHRGELGRRIAHAASLAFDAATYEIWGALLCGATIVVLSKQQLLDPPALAHALSSQRVDTLFLTTALFNHCVAQLGDVLAAMDTVLFGGEQVDPEAARALLEHGGRVRLLHVYGPTENTTFSTWHEVRAVPADARTVPIGRAISGSDCVVLDDYLNAVPAGVSGELYVGGTGLAWGYRARPGLTAERFVPHPWQPGARLYRTGDIVRWNAAGELEFVGRRDHQVKLRGHRIELGEVEVALLGQSGVTLACAQLVEHAGRRRLVAWCEMPAGGSVASLREGLGQRLPDYMVPSALVIVPRLELNANGKIDRERLPQPGEPDERADAPTLLAPREQAMAEVWARVLGVERVGLHDNFFELGGDSLLAIQLKVQAQQKGLDFELAMLFGHPTIAELLPQLKASGDNGPENISTARFALVPEVDRSRLPADLEDAYPASRLQLGMLYHGGVREGEDIYHELVGYRLRLPFDRDALQAVVASQFARHAILRTGIELSRYSVPLQCVHRSVSLPLVVHDERALDDTAQQQRLADWTREEMRRPLRRAIPMLRITVHRWTDEEFQFTYTAHHAIWDGWSESVLTTQLLEDYARELASRAGTGPRRNTQPPLRSTYRDFIALEQAAVEDEKCLAFWREQLTGHEGLCLADRSAAPDDTNLEQYVRNVSLPPSAWEALTKLSQRLGVSLKQVFLAAHVKALSMCSGRSDVVTGLVCNGRPETADGDEIIGLFLNTVPLRQRVGVVSWSEFVREVARSERAIVPYRRYPLPDILRAMGGGSLFDTLFNYTHFRRFEGFKATAAEQVVLQRVGVTLTSVPLAVNFWQNTEGVGAEVAGHLRSVSRELCDRLVQALEAVLRAMAETPDACSASLEPGWPLPAAWTGMLAHSRVPLTVPERIDHWAATTPDAPALDLGDRMLSYAELAGLASAFARRLHEEGVRMGDRVVVDAAEPDLAAVASLAAMRCGAAYLPTSSSWPSERLLSAVRDSGAAVVVSARDLDFTPARQVAAQEMLLSGPAPSAEPPASAAIRALPAYVIYTSGSTGVPKGVPITHDALARLAAWHAESFDVRPGVRCSRLADSGFDAAAWETWGALANGACLCAGPVLAGSTPHRLRDWLVEAAIELAFVPSAMVPPLLALDWPPEASLRVLLTGGDRLPVLPSRAGSLRIVNNYGPTECTVVATSGDIDGSAERPPSIGFPLPGMRVRVVDEFLQDVPCGVVGQLLLGGPALASGYLGARALTASRFVPDPRGDGERLYMTGDLVHAASDGRLHFVGRADDQLSLNGRRVETAEIETAVLRAAEARHARVLPPRSGHGLVAFHDGEIPEPVVRDLLRERLPHYMVPTALVGLPSLPLTPTGKVDERALEAALAERLRHRLAVAVAPRTDAEARMLDVWQAAFGHTAFGVEDDFHEIGGDSLVALAVCERAKAAVGREIPVSQLYRHPSVAALCRWLATGAVQQGPVLHPLHEMEGRPAHYFVHGADGGVERFRLIAQRLAGGAAGLSFDITNARAANTTSFEALAHLYANEIAARDAPTACVLVGWSLGGAVALALAHELRSRGCEARVVLLDACAPSLMDAVEDQLAAAAALARETGLGGTLRTVRHLVSLARSWVPRDGSRADLVLAQTTQDILAAVDAENADDPAGWRRAGVAIGRTVVVPGDHRSLLEQAHVATTTAAIANVLRNPAF